MSRPRFTKKLQFAFVAIGAVLLSPILIPVMLFLDHRNRKMRRRIAEQTKCEVCGTALGKAAIQMADQKCAEEFAVVPKGARYLRIRTVFAICPACGAEYGFDEKRNLYTLRSEGRTGLAQPA